MKILKYKQDGVAENIVYTSFPFLTVAGIQYIPRA